MGFRVVGMISFPSFLGFIVGKPASLKLMGYYSTWSQNFIVLSCSAIICLIGSLSLCCLSLEFLHPYRDKSSTADWSQSNTFAEWRSKHILYVLKPKQAILGYNNVMSLPLWPELISVIMPLSHPRTAFIILPIRYILCSHKKCIVKKPDELKTWLIKNVHLW